MALQDLTPQLRTRLSRMERAVGWFVFLATALLLFGFGYYIYQKAQSKGWFKIKAQFHTFLQSSSGLKVGDNVYMMGFPVGTITSVEPLKPKDPHNVEVEFEIVDPFFRYLWTDGYLKVNPADFLGTRQLEVTRGTNGYELVLTQPVSIHTLDDARRLMADEPDHWQLAQEILDSRTNVLFLPYTPLEEVFSQTNAALLARADLPSNSIYIYNQSVNRHRVVASWDGRYRHYKIFRPGDDTAWIHAVETPPLSDQLQTMVLQVQTALPNVLALTNRLNLVLDNAAQAASNVNLTLVETRPVLTNLAVVTAQLREPGGPALWVLGTNGNAQLQGALTNVNGLLTNVNILAANTDTNLTALLINLADITGNLNAQVQANSNMLSGISKIVVDTDDFVQGLKRLFRSAFRKENAAAGRTNAPPPDLRPPRER